MQLNDQRDIKAAPDVVWAAILDPQMLQAAIPGCESVSGSVENGFEAVVTQKVGPVKATFTGMVRFSDIQPGQGLTISGEGKGGPAGFAKGGAKVRLDPIPEGTRLSYEVDASVGGKLAQLGSRIIDGFAKKMADEFFQRFQQAVEGPVTVAEEEAAPEEPAPEGEPKKGWFKRLLG